MDGILDLLQPLVYLEPYVCKEELAHLRQLHLPSGSLLPRTCQIHYPFGELTVHPQLGLLQFGLQLLRDLCAKEYN